MLDVRIDHGYPRKPLPDISQAARWTPPSRSLVSGKPSAEQTVSMCAYSQGVLRRRARRRGWWRAVLSHIRTNFLTLSQSRFTSASESCLHWLSCAIHPSTSFSMFVFAGSGPKVGRGCWRWWVLREQGVLRERVSYVTLMH